MAIRAHTLSLAGALLIIGAAASVGAQDECASLFGVDTIGNFSAIFNADPGEFSGVPEGHFFLANLKDNITVPSNKTVCGKIVKGTLMGQAVAIVLTGIGPTPAAMCTLEFVDVCGEYITEIIYSGTSGWSPQVGGTFPNPPDCASANPTKNITRLGDLCVSPFTVNWGCKQASWAMQAGGFPNECYKPKEIFGPTAAFLYGQCLFYEDNAVANLELSMAILEAMEAGAKNFPKRSMQVAGYESEYWNITSSFTGISYPYTATDPVTVYGFDVCMEIDDQFFYSGAPWDYTAREYVALTLSKATNQTFNASEVIAVSAMEGIGVASAMEKYHKLATTNRKIPYTNVRGMSDWVNLPVKQTSPGVWGQEATNFEFPFSVGYAYAIATYSAGIMSFYQARCNNLVKANQLPANTNCSFTVTYP